MQRHLSITYCSFDYCNVRYKLILCLYVCYYAGVGCGIEKGGKFIGYVTALTCTFPYKKSHCRCICVK